MPLSPNHRLDHYVLTEIIGEGGMGTVWKARDTTLDRDVAIKVLPPEFSTDPERLARFEREAKAVAALSHPNIVAIHGFGTHEGNAYAAIELLAGRALDRHLEEGPLPPRKALEIARQIATGLAAAHAKGIVHRDLKPGNVFLSPDGRARILDFGLAAVANPSGHVATTELATRTSLTNPGAVMGTANYMSPEQVQGLPADSRADIFALGTMLHEMLTGRRPFERSTAAETMTAVLREDAPEITADGKPAPPAIAGLISRCLEKSPDERFQNASDLAYALGNASMTSGSSVAGAEPLARPQSKSLWPRFGMFAAATLLFAAALALVALAVDSFRVGTPPSAHATSQRLTIPIDGTTNFIREGASPPVISPDGRLIAYGMTDDEGVDQLWIRPIDSFDARPLDGTSGAQLPFWSPNSRDLGFFLGGRVRRIEVATGRIQTIGGEGAFRARGATWTPNDQILFAPSVNTGIWIVDAGGGAARQITTPDPNVADVSHRWPHALPDGKHFLFLVWSNNAEALSEHGGIYVGSIDGSSEPRRIVAEPSSAIYTRSGHLMVMQGHNLIAIPFDADQREIIDDAFVVADGVLINRNNGHALFSASEDGALVFARDVGSAPSSSYFWADRGGELTKTPLEPGVMFIHPWGTAEVVRLSPDASRAATTSPGPTGDPEVWVLDLLRGVRTRLTPSAPYTCESPIWSPTGDRILYTSSKTGAWDLYTRNVDGSGQEEPLLQSSADKVATDWRGNRVLYWEEDLGSGGIVFSTYDISTGEATTILEHPDYLHVRFSPDGDYVIYEANEDGRSQVFIQQIEGGARWQVSTNGGRFAHWSDDGREIVYLDPHQRVTTVNVTIDDAGLALGQPEELFQIVQNVVAWDVTGDHSRFLLATRPERESDPLYVILNWNVPDRDL